MLQYFIIGWQYGNSHANKMAVLNLPYGLLMITFLVILFSTIQIKRGEWKTISILSIIPQVSLRGLGRLDHFVRRKPDIVNSNIRLRLRFFTPKNNPYLGLQLPVLGEVIKEYKVSGESGWFLIELNKPLNVRNCLALKVLVRSKDPERTIHEDKIELEFMMLPKAELLSSLTIEKSELFPIERVYSMCLS